MSDKNWPFQDQHFPICHVLLICFLLACFIYLFKDIDNRLYVKVKDNKKSHHQTTNVVKTYFGCVPYNETFKT